MRQIRFSFVTVCALLGALPQIQAADRFVAAGGNLQAAINAAVPGDTITIQAGASFTGPFYLPNKSGSQYITIQSSAMAQLPAGSRVNPSQAAYMPKLVSPTYDSAIIANSGAHHYKLTGLEIVTAPNYYNYGLIVLGYGNETSVSSLPQYIELDRMYIHGDPQAGTKRAINLNSRDTVIRDCYISDIKSTVQEANAIQGWNGPGPYQILNNYIESSTIGVLFGGADVAIPNMIPSDITVKGNYFFKPVSWKPGTPNFDGRYWWVKNHFELKNAQRVTVDGNIFENNWQSQQMGFAILFTPRSENGNVPWAVVQDVTFTHNLIRHAGAGLAVSGMDDNGQGYGQRITIRDNLFDDISSSNWGGYGRLYQVLNRTQNITFDHNTGFQDVHAVFFDGVPNSGFVFTNNVGPHNEYGICGSGYGVGTQALNYYAPGSTVTGNVLAGKVPYAYPGGNSFPADLSAIGFVNLLGTDFRLLPTSPYVNAGTDGKAAGADVLTTASLLANVWSGTSASVTKVAISPASVSLRAGDVIKLNSTVAGALVTSVVWSMASGPGSVDSMTGLYRAPVSLSASSTAVVQATSVADPSRSAQISIALSPLPAYGGISAVRVNVGGPAYTDGSGNVWSADNGFDGGYLFSTLGGVSSSNAPTLYQTQRYTYAPLTYTFGVPSGSYNVTLKFAELSVETTGMRLFHVDLNGTRVLNNFDVYTNAGGALRGVDKTFPVNVTGNQVVITLSAVKSSAILNGIEITPTGTAAPPPATVALSLSPGSASVTAGQTQQFTASVTGTANTAVTWSLNPNVGTLVNGLYSAPSSITSAQTVTVTATSQADSSKSASATVTLNPTAGSGGSFTPIAVNAGGIAYTDGNGTSWAADNGFNGGGIWTNFGTVGNTSTPLVYQTQRYSYTPLTYSTTVPNGSYNVTLKFAELSIETTGQRLFHVDINGARVLTNFDVYANAGGALKAIDKTFPVSVTNGQMVITFTAVSSSAIINAIQITQGSATPKSVIRINAGGSSYTDPNGVLWAADNGFSGGSVWSNFNTVAGTGTSPLYQIQRYSYTPLTYTIPMNNGSYNVTLMFAELSQETTGQRLFHVDINGARVLTNFDVYANAGGALKAIDKTFPVSVTNGQMVITFTAVSSSAIINAIQIQ